MNKVPRFDFGEPKAFDGNLNLAETVEDPKSLPRFHACFDGAHPQCCVVPLHSGIEQDFRNRLNVGFCTSKEKINQRRVCGGRLCCFRV